MERNRILLGDNLDLMAGIEDESIQLVYADPPFNTGRRQARRSVRTIADAIEAHDANAADQALAELAAYTVTLAHDATAQRKAASD